MGGKNILKVFEKMLVYSAAKKLVPEMISFICFYANRPPMNSGKDTKREPIRYETVHFRILGGIGSEFMDKGTVEIL
jgi:hypothetical protein